MVFGYPSGFLWVPPSFLGALPGGGAFGAASWGPRVSFLPGARAGRASRVPCHSSAFGGFMSSFNSFLPAAPAALSGGVPSSFSVSVGSAPVASSGFLPALPGAVVLSAPSDLPGLLFRGPGGAPSLRVAWSCSVSGLSGSLVARAAGFPGGAGGAASGAFFAAVEAAVASGVPVFVGGAPGARSGSVFPGFFCAVSSSPFGEAPASSAAPLRF